LTDSVKKRTQITIADKIMQNIQFNICELDFSYNLYEFHSAHKVTQPIFSPFTLLN